jgi:hypothetical protein
MIENWTTTITYSLGFKIYMICSFKSILPNQTLVFLRIKIKVIFSLVELWPIPVCPCQGSLNPDSMLNKDVYQISML